MTENSRIRIDAQSAQWFLFVPLRHGDGSRFQCLVLKMLPNSSIHGATNFSAPSMIDDQSQLIINIAQALSQALKDQGGAGLHVTRGRNLESDARIFHNHSIMLLAIPQCMRIRLF